MAQNNRKAGEAIKENKAVLEAVDRADKDIKYTPISKEELNERIRGGGDGSRNIQNMDRDTLHSLGRREHELDEKMSKAEFRAAMKSRGLSAQEAYDEMDEGQKMNARLQDFLKSKMVDLGKPKNDAPPVTEEPDFDADIEPEPEVETKPIYSGDINVNVGTPAVGDMPSPGVSPGVAVPGISQNIGKVGDMITTIGHGNTFGDNVSIGNDESTTFGANYAGDNGYFGSMVSSEKRRRAAEGAFAPGVTNGLNFS